MEGNQEFGAERRRCLRQRVHGPAFASFDGVTGGMILDLSEEGLSMQTDRRLDEHPLDWHRLDSRPRGGHHPDESHPDFDEPGFAKPGPDKNGPDGQQRVRLGLELAEPAAHLETTGYIAWADALGRAGVRFSDLPEEARVRLNEWLTLNAGAPSRTAPKLTLGRAMVAAAGAKPAGMADRDHMSISLEAETDAEENEDEGAASTTAQYQFSSLGTDLAAALRLIGERARSLTRGTSAAIALVHKNAVMCRASVGAGAPALGTRLDVNSGFAGECFRSGKALRCDDAENDPRVDLETCRKLRIRSMLAAPVRYERDTVGLLMVFAAEPFNFDEGDVAVVESLAHTVIRSMRQADGIRR
jgi:putative methionine-R-sulfoxide reductase with GAF domain